MESNTDYYQIDDGAKSDVKVKVEQEMVNDKSNTQTVPKSIEKKSQSTSCYHTTCGRVSIEAILSLVVFGSSLLVNQLFAHLNKEDSAWHDVALFLSLVCTYGFGAFLHGHLYGSAIDNKKCSLTKFSLGRYTASVLVLGVSFVGWSAELIMTRALNDYGMRSRKNFIASRVAL